MTFPSFDDLHKYLGEIFLFMFAIGGAVEAFLWQAKRIRHMWREFKADSPGDHQIANSR